MPDPNTDTDIITALSLCRNEMVEVMVRVVERIRERVVGCFICVLALAALLVPGERAYAQTDDKSDQTGGKSSPARPALPPTPTPSAGEPGPIPPEKFTVAPGGVDMRTGMYMYSSTDLSIGDKEGGLALSRNTARGLQVFGLHHDRFGTQFGHNWDIFISEQRIPVAGANTPGQWDYQITINYEGLGTTFRTTYRPDLFPFKQVSNDGLATLTYTGAASAGAIYTFTAKDGTKVEFRPINSYDCTYYYRCAYATKVTKTDGTIYTLEYDNSGGPNPDMTRLRSVTSNRGYALLFEYNAPTGSGTLVYNLINKACVINLTTMVKPATNVCPAGVQTVSYAYSGTFMTTYTDPTTAAWTYAKTGSAPNYTVAFKKPGAATPYLTNSIYENTSWYQAVTGQAFADGRTYAYVWDYYAQPSGGTSVPPPEIAGGQYTDNNGKVVKETYGWYNAAVTGITTPLTPETFQATAGPITMTDELNRTWTADYCYPSGAVSSGCYAFPLKSQTAPEGNSVVYTYDGLRNVIQTNMKAKPGSGLSDIITYATYPCTPGIPATCAKPVTTTDARGNVTTYSYDPSTWQVLTETHPAVLVDGTGSAIAPSTVYGYTLRRAWISNGAGGYVASTDYVSLLTSTRTCRTTAMVSGACAGGTADTVLTAYDYGPDSGPNNLLLRGMTVTADVGGVSTTLRTCYGYDAQGNRISETKPRAGLTVCP